VAQLADRHWLATQPDSWLAMTLDLGQVIVTLVDGRWLDSVVLLDIIGSYYYWTGLVLLCIV
jgi:hypothetical protein